MAIQMGLVLLVLTWAGRNRLGQERERAAGRFFSEHAVKDVAPAVRDALDVFLAALLNRKSRDVDSIYGFLR